MINEAKMEIKRRFGCLIKSGMLKVTIDGNILTLSGTIDAVQAMDRFVMQKYYPNHCKPPEKSEIDGKATYTYKF